MKINLLQIISLLSLSTLALAQHGTGPNGPDPMGSSANFNLSRQDLGVRQILQTGSKARTGVITDDGEGRGFTARQSRNIFIEFDAYSAGKPDKKLGQVRLPIKSFIAINDWLPEAYDYKNQRQSPIYIDWKGREGLRIEVSEVRELRFLSVPLDKPHRVYLTSPHNVQQPRYLNEDLVLVTSTEKLRDTLEKQAKDLAHHYSRVSDIAEYVREELEVTNWEEVENSVVNTLARYCNSVQRDFQFQNDYSLCPPVYQWTQRLSFSFDTEFKDIITHAIAWEDAEDLANWVEALALPLVRQLKRKVCCGPHCKNPCKIEKYTKIEYSTDKNKLVRDFADTFMGWDQVSAITSEAATTRPDSAKYKKLIDELKKVWKDFGYDYLLTSDNLKTRLNQPFVDSVREVKDLFLNQE